MADQDFELAPEILELCYKYGNRRLEQKFAKKRECIHYCDKFKDHIIGSWIKGLSMKEIERKYGVCESTPRTWIKMKYGNRKNTIRGRFLDLIKNGVKSDQAIKILLNNQPTQPASTTGWKRKRSDGESVDSSGSHQSESIDEKAASPSKKSKEKEPTQEESDDFIDMSNVLK